MWICKCLFMCVCHICPITKALESSFFLGISITYSTILYNTKNETKEII